MEYIVSLPDENRTKRMVSKPPTPLLKLLGQKWFLSLEKLSDRSGVSITALQHLFDGKPIGVENERRLRRFLESYKGECVERKKGKSVGALLKRLKTDETEAARLGVSVEEYRACVYGKKGG